MKARNIDIRLQCECGNILIFIDGSYTLEEINITCSQCNITYNLDPKKFPKTK